MTGRTVPEAGQFWSPRYSDPARTIRIRALDRTRVEAVVVAYPSRPQMVRSTVAMSRHTLLAKWRLEVAA